MTVKLCLALFAAMVTLQTTWTFPSECNVPRCYLPIIPEKIRGGWYDLADTVETSTSQCKKVEFFTSNSDQHGMLTYSLRNSDGTYSRIPYFVNYTQVGYMIYGHYPDTMTASWNFAVQIDCESYLLFNCIENNGVTFAQYYFYISQRRNVSEQVINNAFTSNNVSLSNVRYINQEGCNN